jgi:hypothetical protein
VCCVTERDVIHFSYFKFHPRVNMKIAGERDSPARELAACQNATKGEAFSFIDANEIAARRVRKASRSDG